MSQIPVAAQLLVCALLIAAAVQDGWSLTISNLWPALIIGLFMPTFALGALQGTLVSHLLHFVLALAVCMGLFALGGFGGGDAKLYAAIALWFPLDAALSLFVSVVLAGLLLAVAFLSIRMLQTRETRARAMRKGKIPYGVAITIGAIFALPNIIL